jgi:hypothetical protein
MTSYWVYENWRAHGHRATIHRSDCGFCNDGTGVHGGGQTSNGRWHGRFTSAGEARSAVASRVVTIRDCRWCAP